MRMQPEVVSMKAAGRSSRLHSPKKLSANSHSTAREEVAALRDISAVQEKRRQFERTTGSKGNGRTSPGSRHFAVTVANSKCGQSVPPLPSCSTRLTSTNLLKTVPRTPEEHACYLRKQRELVYRAEREAEVRKHVWTDRGDSVMHSYLRRMRPRTRERLCVRWLEYWLEQREVLGRGSIAAERALFERMVDDVRQERGKGEGEGEVRTLDDMSSVGDESAPAHGRPLAMPLMDDSIRREGMKVVEKLFQQLENQRAGGAYAGEPHFRPSHRPSSSQAAPRPPVVYSRPHTPTPIHSRSPQRKSHNNSPVQPVGPMARRSSPPVDREACREPVSLKDAPLMIPAPPPPCVVDHNHMHEAPATKETGVLRGLLTTSASSSGKAAVVVGKDVDADGMQGGHGEDTNGEEEMDRTNAPNAPEKQQGGSAAMVAACVGGGGWCVVDKEQGGSGAATDEQEEEHWFIRYMRGLPEQVVASFVLGY
ncbi:unnamed protein product [Vitrella brassicaformis CCMP3155]|uniref:Uncharacterized protein n=2 Tax=Vitrella brassicaformis TaxID=1169539 RepID=A0A0G4GJ53_VITBC|nr:unnamed protein product [Vitrella brassicaformis CCMP3155]|eukprot:CEM29862.1 unnamed protein product [Vitrella brassicaformis CCMP3155]